MHTDRRAPNTYTDEPFLPVAVYGTLRAGQGNYTALLAGRTISERRGVAHGQALYVDRLPYIVDREGTCVVVDVLEIAPVLYPAVLARLDRLEGYRANDPRSSHYVRVRRPVRVSMPGGGSDEIACWMYQAGPRIAARLVGARPIAGGDWLLFRTEEDSPTAWRGAPRRVLAADRSEEDNPWADDDA